MARARNIKPSFFKNDELAEIDPLGRLLFIGLWSLCDFKGEMEWREKRVKAEILPYDNCNILELAINLDQSGFIRYYSSQGKMYLNIPNFIKHQNPHINERKKGSDIPKYSSEHRQVVELKGLVINRDLSGLEPEYSESDRADSCSLIPDSCSLIPEVKTLVDDSTDMLDEKIVKQKRDVIPYQQIANLYNEILGTEFGKIRDIASDQRKKNAKNLWSKVSKNLEGVETYFKYFSYKATDHHRGNGDSSFKADYNFITSKTIVSRFLDMLGDESAR